MNPHPLAILLVFRNDKDLAEKTLTSIYTNLNEGYLLYVVDDASEDDTAQTIQSVIEHFSHEQTFFYENPTELGRERSIKELMQLIESPMIWMPESIDAEFSDLKSVSGMLQTSDVSTEIDTEIKSIVEKHATGDTISPDSIAAKWLSAVQFDEVDQVVDETNDSAQSVTKGVQSEVENSEKHQGSPELESTEQTSRKTDLPIVGDDDFDEPDFEGVVGKVRPMRKSSEKAEPEKPKKNPVKFKPSFRSNSIELPEDASQVAQEVFVKVQEFVSEGENLYALKAIDAVQVKHPNDVALIKLKIKVLEFMRRYVEAAELKHQLKLGGPGVARPKVRREAILIVDPTEDVEGTVVVDKQEPKKTASIASDVADLSDDVLVDDEVHPQEQAELDEGGDVSNALTEEIVSEVVTKEAPEVEKSEVDVIEEEVSKRDEVVEPEHKQEDTSDVEMESVESVGEFQEEETETMESEIDINDVINAFIHQEAEEEQSETEELPLVRPKSYSKEPRISIVIPTTIDGKTLLERTIISLSTKADKEDRELIVVDNASLDDTYEYLNHLKRENFMQIRVITNPENYGFARAVNQAMAIARGKYVLIMHNDITIDTDVPGKMADIMDQHDEVTTLGPLTRVTWCDEQRRKSVDPDENVIRTNRFIDSFCMMLRKSKARKFDERYGLAHFDDMDYCLEDTKNGGVVAIATGLKVNHLGGATTNVIGRESYSRPYWKNASEFETKWDALPQLAPFTEDDTEIEKLTMISELLNPFYPEGHLIDLANEIMTSEVRNDIIEGNYSVAQHVALIRLMMILDMRDVARVLEDKLDPKEFDDALMQQLIDFYYQKNIYSRSLKYLKKIDHSKKPFSFKLIELKVYMGARELDKAATLLSELIGEVPTHPVLYKITSDIHKLQGNKTEAEEFYALAHQTDPYTYK